MAACFSMPIREIRTIRVRKSKSNAEHKSNEYAEWISFAIVRQECRTSYHSSLSCSTKKFSNSIIRENKNSSAWSMLQHAMFFNLSSNDDRFGIISLLPIF